MKNTSCSVFGDINVLDKDASRQYLYCLTPEVTNTSSVRLKNNSISVGLLDIIWRSNLGEKGHLQTSTLQTMVRIYFYPESIVEFASYEYIYIFFSVRRSRRYSIVSAATTEYRFSRKAVSISVQNIKYIVSINFLLRIFRQILPFPPSWFKYPISRIILLELLECIFFFFRLLVFITLLFFTLVLLH